MIRELETLVARVDALAGPDAAVDAAIKATAEVIGSPVPARRGWPPGARFDFTAEDHASITLAVYFDLGWQPVMMEAARDPQWTTARGDNGPDTVPPRRFTLAILRAKLTQLRS